LIKIIVWMENADWKVDVHCALLNIAGQVSEDDKVFNPTNLAEKFWELYDQEKEAWTLDLDVLGPQ